MAYMQKNTAYDFSLFEEKSSAAPKLPEQPLRSPKKNNVVKISQKQIEKIRRRKHNPVKLISGVTFALAVLFVISTIIVGQVQLTEINQRITAAKKDLDEQQSIYTQMEMKVNENLSASVVEEYAKNELGMSKATNAQKEFVNLSEGDKAVVSAKEQSNIFETIAEAFAGLWS